MIRLIQRTRHNASEHRYIQLETIRQNNEEQEEPSEDAPCFLILGSFTSRSHSHTFPPFLANRRHGVTKSAGVQNPPRFFQPCTYLEGLGVNLDHQERKRAKKT